MDLNLGRFLLETRLTDIQKYRPSKPDSFGWLGTGTQYLKVDVLYRILSDFFGQSNIRMNNNDIYITPPTIDSCRCQKGILFRGIGCDYDVV